MLWDVASLKSATAIFSHLSVIKPSWVWNHLSWHLFDKLKHEAGIFSAAPVARRHMFTSTVQMTGCQTDIPFSTKKTPLISHLIYSWHPQCGSERRSMVRPANNSHQTIKKGTSINVQIKTLRSFSLVCIHMLRHKGLAFQRAVGYFITGAAHALVSGRGHLAQSRLLDPVCYFPCDQSYTSAS